jgi:hypothetical protein
MWKIHRRNGTCLQHSGRRKRPLVRPKHRWENQIKIDLKETVWRYCKFSAILLWTRWWNFGLHKIRISGIATKEGHVLWSWLIFPFSVVRGFSIWKCENPNYVHSTRFRCLRSTVPSVVAGNVSSVPVLLYSGKVLVRSPTYHRALANSNCLSKN